jgi:hypothetical protein
MIAKFQSVEVLKAIRSAAWSKNRTPRSRSRESVRGAVIDAILAVAERFGCTSSRDWSVAGVSDGVIFWGKVDVAWFDLDEYCAVAAFEVDRSCSARSLRNLVASRASLKVLVSYSTGPSKYKIPEGVLWLRLGLLKSRVLVRRSRRKGLKSFHDVAVEEHRET